MDNTPRAFSSNGPDGGSFLAEMIRGFSGRQRQVDELFSHGDTDRSGSVNLKDFELAFSACASSCECQIKIILKEKEIRKRYGFVRLRVRLIPFHAAAAHPGHFEVVLSSSSRVFSLVRMIQDRVGIQTSGLEVFRSTVPTEEARLPPECSLEECGFKGGPEESPPEDSVYYDYRLLFTDCPILNCDHYFRSKPDSAAARSSQSPRITQLS